MRIIPVIDLMGGQVVRGIAGRRSEYRPIQSSIAADSRPGTVARALMERFGFETVYVADLDAIQKKEPAVRAWQEINDAGLKLWLDASAGTPQSAAEIDRRFKEMGTDSSIVVGLETLEAPLILVDIVRCLGPERIVFSLDLAQGRPLTEIGMWKDEPPCDIVRWVVRAGVKRLIVLDLADVGVGGGTGTVELCREVRHEFRSMELVAGGGVRGVSDLEALASAGCDAALVASALHDGRLTREEIRQIEKLRH